jgi:tetratricopeptide (TPR) repeat protein
MRKMAVFILSVATVCACAQTMPAFQGAAGRTNQPAEGGVKSVGRGRTPRTNAPPPPPPPLPSARLTVHVNLPHSTVEFDGKDMGPTDEHGYMNLPPATNGQHTLIVRKSGYYDYRQVVELASGLNGTLEVTLPPRPGRLSVMPNLPGASISVAGVGSYNGSAEGVELAPGSYRVSVTKLGYAALEQNVTIEPGMSRNLTITLTRLSPGELMSLAESEFQAGRYEQTITLSEMALADMPSHPRLMMLLGLSYFRLNNLPASLNYLQQTLMLGQSLTLNVKHFHKLKKGEGFCQGQLLLRRGAIEFRSDENPSENFVVPFNKVVGMRPDPDKGWRVSMQVLLPDPKKKNKKEKGFDYSFHPAQAYLRNKDPRKQNSPMLVACFDCQPMAQFIYQLIQQASR